MSLVLLVRHGQATFGLGTYDRLSDHGREQATHLARVLGERGVSVDRIISGDLDRQRETADLIATELGGGLAATVDPAWNEYDHVPLIARVKPMYRKQWLMVADLSRSGNPGRKLQEVIDEALVDWVARERDGGGPPDDPSQEPVETYGQYAERARVALDRAAAHDGTTLVVSSAGTIAQAVAPLVGVPADAWPTLHRVMVNSSLSKVVRGRRGLSLVSFNEHGHLEGVPGLKITYR